MNEDILDRYYRNIINLISENYTEEFSEAKPGHCMKITGLPNERLFPLWEELKTKYDNLDVYIVDENNADDSCISATKLIELRNKQDKPLLILLPSNNRTAAEDSYGNATFKEISLEDIESVLLKSLEKNIPSEYSKTIKDILKYISINNPVKKINYLLAIELDGYTNESIGKHLYLLGLIPDTKLLNDSLQLQYRLNLNKTSCENLVNFSVSIYDRIDQLKIEKDTLQKDFINLFRKEKDILSVETLVTEIYKNYQNLWFNKWDIPDLNFKKVKLEVSKISSSNFEIEDGIKYLIATENRTAKVKIRFTTSPSINLLTEVDFFRIILMRVDGERGEEVQTLRKVKNTKTTRPYKDVTIDLDPNLIEEDSYFLKVLAEDEAGNIINRNDDFYDDAIQEHWKNQGESEEAKAELPYKLKCDSEDFYFQIDESTEPDEKLRKDKLNNVLQAAFKYNKDELKEKQQIVIPEPSEHSNIWLNDSKTKLSSVFHIHYSDKHNYQIILSTKLRLIENELLDRGEQLGYIIAELSSNSKKAGLENCAFTKSKLTELAPNALLSLRSELFEAIKNSNKNGNGVFETTNILALKSTIEQYLLTYKRWLNELKEKIDNFSLTGEETQLHFAEVQFLDTVKVKTKLPDGTSVYTILLSPLHPLRLSWFLSLINKYEEWYEETLAFEDYIDSWSSLEELFLGKLNPTNNPYVFVDPNQFTNYEYLGELCFGWGIYIDTTSNEEKEDSLVPIAYQIKHYLKHLFNIDSSNIVNDEISKNLVVRHLKNYLIQHPYTETLIINLFNVGDARTFADSFVELNKYSEYVNTKFEIRIFIGQESIIEHGLALKQLINPETNITEEAELFSQPSKNRLFPKLRFSINNINMFIENPLLFNSHISFLVNPFPADISLYKPIRFYKSSYMNGLIIDSTTEVETVDETGQTTWNNFVDMHDQNGNVINNLYSSFQYFTSGSLAINATDSIPSTQLELNNRDVVLLSHLHEYSDWVITFDKNLGPQIFDQPTEDGKIPYLLDYIPGEEITGVSSYLTTKPSSEITGLLSPHFKDFGVNSEDGSHLVTIQTILEDIRAVSSSLLLQLNSSKTRAFEAIGVAFSKRVLEKKDLLRNAFIIPIDLHKNLFEDNDLDSKSRADNLVLSIEPESRIIKISVLEIKCRTYLGDAERDELKVKMLDQINNTIETIKLHFDPTRSLSKDRLDREIKNKELKSLLSFYIERAFRYNFLDVNAYNTYNDFIQTLDEGFEFEFNKLGFIFDYSFNNKHHKQNYMNEATIFTFGKSLIEEILDEDSDLNTNRLEENEFREDLVSAFNINEKLEKFIAQNRRSNSIDKEDEDEDEVEEEIDDTSTSKQDADDNLEEEINVTEEVEEEDDAQQNDKTESSSTSIVEKPYMEPDFDIFIGKNKPTEQFGILGTSIHGKRIAMDFAGVNTISLFGVPGAGKSYTIGTISEMVLKQFSDINKLSAPLAGVIFHYNESMEYEPEFTSMMYPNSKASEIKKLKEVYGAEPDNIDDVVILTPKDKVSERQAEFPSLEVHGISFNSNELNVKDWLFLLGAIGNDSVYIRQLKFMMREMRDNITLEGLRTSVEESELLSTSQKALARQRLNFAGEYIDDNSQLRELLKPGRLIIVDLRDEFIVKDEALGLFVIMLNIFSSVTEYDGKHFNKFIVFDEAHKYMDNKDLTGTIVTSIREMRHKGVNIMIASQDPPSLPIDIIELSSVLVLHKFTSPGWLKHIKKSNSSMDSLTPSDMSMLKPGEAFIWAKEATDTTVTIRPLKISTRPRLTMHGGATKQAL